MKTTVLALVAWLCIALPAMAHKTPAPKAIKEKRSIAAFTILRIDGPFEITLTSGETGTLTLEGDKDILSIITTQVTGDTLKIATLYKQTLPAIKKHIKIKVPFTLLYRVDMTGSGSLKVGKILKNDITLMLDGCGSIDVCANATNVTTCVIGAGEIKLDGVAQNFTAKIIGPGHINGYNLEAKNVTALVAGPGEVKTACIESLVGRINGSGSISFTGNPILKDLKRSGSGEFTML